MDILELIKNRRTIRRYQDKAIPKEILDKIIEAGIWGPSVPSFLNIQPWKFTIIIDKKLINRLSKILLKKSEKTGIGVNILLRSAANIIESAHIRGVQGPKSQIDIGALDAQTVIAPCNRIPLEGDGKEKAVEGQGQKRKWCPFDFQQQTAYQKACKCRYQKSAYQYGPKRGSRH